MSESISEQPFETVIAVEHKDQGLVQIVQAQRSGADGTVYALASVTRRFLNQERKDVELEHWRIQMDQCLRTLVAGV